MATPLSPGADALVPTGPGYDVVLLAHVACALIGLVTVVVSGIQAARLLGRGRGGAAAGAGLTRYFAPGVNWAGRTLYGVPLFGFALITMSRGSISTGDSWVLTGLVLWAVAAALAEGLLWPAERRIQAHLSPAAAEGAAGLGSPDLRAPRLVRDARTVCASAAAVVVVVMVAFVVMVAQP